MKVGFVVPSLETGGLQVALLRNVHSLVSRGHEAAILTLRSDSAAQSLADDARLAGASVSAPDGGGYRASSGLADLIGAVREVRVWVRRESPDLVETATWDADVPTRLAVGSHSVPIVTRLISMPYDLSEYSPSRIRSFKLQLLRRFENAVPSPALRVANSGAISSHYVRATPRLESVSPSVVVHRGVEITDQPLHPLLLPGEPAMPCQRRMRLLSVGRLVLSKNVGLGLEAAASVGASVTVAGTGPETDSLRARFAKADIDFVGEVRNVPELMTTHDALLFTPLWEGIGNVVLEAMAVGLPVLASRIDSMDEVLGEERISFDPSLVSDIESALARFSELSANDLATIARRQRHLVEKNFDQEKQFDQLLKLYQRIAD